MPPRIRTDLNGLRVRLPKHAPIYLVDEGKKRHIPNPQVYNELFKDWTGVVADNQVKRHVASPAVMEHYHFNWDHIHVWNVPLSAIGYPDGTQIRNPPNV
jgi:hypothetical protein